MNRVALMGALVMTNVLLFSHPGWAGKAYVTDSFEITLRTGPSTENKVIAMPASGQPVEILDSKGEWSHVRLLGEAEQEGWVVSRFLITRRPWEKQAKALKQENTELKANLDEVKKKLNERVAEGKNLKAELAAASASLEALREDYKSLKRGSEGYLKLKANHQQVKTGLKHCQEEVERLTEENEDLASSQMNRWFAIGALVLLCGLMIGVIIGKQEKKRRSLYK